MKTATTQKTLIKHFKIIILVLFYFNFVKNIIAVAFIRHIIRKTCKIFHVIFKIESNIIFSVIFRKS